MLHSAFPPVNLDDAHAVMLTRTNKKSRPDIFEAAFIVE